MVSDCKNYCYCRSGRHDPITPDISQAGYALSDLEKEAFGTIYQYQRSDLTARLAAIPYSVRPCCLETISDLGSEPLKIYFQTKLSNDAWKKERTLRITG